MRALERLRASRGLRVHGLLVGRSRLDDPAMKGKLLHLMIIVRRARGIPTKLMSQVFVSFKFFLRKEPCATARCASAAATASGRSVQHVADESEKGTASPGRAPLNLRRCDPRGGSHGRNCVAKDRGRGFKWARGEQGRELQAAADLNQAARLYRQGGEEALADELDAAAQKLREAPKRQKGNGWGSAVLGGAAGVLKQLAPYALKMMGQGLL